MKSANAHFHNRIDKSVLANGSAQGKLDCLFGLHISESGEDTFLAFSNADCLCDCGNERLQTSSAK